MSIGSNPQHHGTVARFERFFEQREVAAFVVAGGRVHLATEGHSADMIRTLIAIGHRHFSEKYIQEVQQKWSDIQSQNITLHLFGKLQSNKLKPALGLFDVLESIDRERLVERLNRLHATRHRVGELYIQINTGREEQKAGVFPEHAAAFLQTARSRTILPVTGVMAIPPRAEDPVPHFRWLRDFADRHGLEHCMMGMSDDFRQAIACGATRIRVGRVVFGERTHG